MIVSAAGSIDKIPDLTKNKDFLKIVIKFIEN